MSATYQWDPKELSVTVGTKILAGFVDGSFVEVERYEDAYVTKVGVAGEATRIRKNNRSGHFDFMLQSSSPSNDDLSVFLLADELSNSGVVPILVNDASGRTIVKATTAWGKKFPAAKFANGDVSEWKWVFDTGFLEINNLGGSLSIE